MENKTEQSVKQKGFQSNEELKVRIAYLERVKDIQEEVLRRNIVEVHKSLQPMELVRNAIDKIRQDTEVGEKTSGLIGSLAINYLAGKLVRDKGTPIGYIKSVVVSRIASFLYRKNEKDINGFIGNLTRKALKKGRDRLE